MTVWIIVLFLFSRNVWQRFYSVFLLKITYTKHSVLLNLLLLHLGPRYPGLHPYEQVPFKSWHWVTFKQCIHSVWHPSSYVPFSHSFMKYENEKKKKHVREIEYHEEHYTNNYTNNDLKHYTCKPHILKNNKLKAVAHFE